MSREKQIEEMAKEVCRMMCKSHVFCEAQEPCGTAVMMAVNICKEGWCKQSEVAREIFAEIERMVKVHLNCAEYSDGDLAYDIAELKKKYTEGET